MKGIACFLVLAVLTAGAYAQYSVAVVTDPIEQLAHSEDMTQWAQSIQALNTQINQLNQQIQTLQTVQSYIGNPSSAAGSMGLGDLGVGSLGTSVGQLTSQISQTVNGAQALQNTGNGLFSAVSQTMPSGGAMSFNMDSFKPFAAVQAQGQNVATVIADTLGRITQLQTDKAQTLSQIQTASDQSTVQKLQAKANAIDGQIAALNSQQTTAQGQLSAQQIANQNDKALKAAAANAAADQEMSVSLQNYSQWQGQIAPSHADFK